MVDATPASPSLGSDADAEALERRASYVSLLSDSGIVFVGLAIHLLLMTGTEVLAARYLGPVSYGLISWGVMMRNGDSASLRGALILITSLTGGGAFLS